MIVDTTVLMTLDNDKTHLHADDWQPAYGSPAGAGIDPADRSRLAAWAGFPRRRGDRPQARVDRPKSIEVPPQARG